MLQYCSKLLLVKVCHQIPREAEHPPLVHLCKGTWHCHLSRYERSHEKGDSSIRAPQMPAQAWEIPDPTPLDTDTRCTPRKHQSTTPHLSVTFRAPTDPRCLLRVDDAVHLASTWIRPSVLPHLETACPGRPGVRGAEVSAGGRRGRGAGCGGRASPAPGPGRAATALRPRARSSPGRARKPAARGDDPGDRGAHPS